VTLEELARKVPNFAALNHAEKIKLFIWWLHTYDGKSYVQPKDVGGCYTKLSLSPPADVASFFRSFLERSPKQLLKNSEGYRLERGITDALTEKYGQRDSTIHVDKLLTTLPAKLAKPDERTYLEETLICFRNKAFRAAVVMAWNLAYDHLCHWILADKDRLADFNARSPLRYPKEKYPPVVQREDLTEMKESHVIAIALSAGLITTNVFRVLDEKLTRRNMAAHPSDVSTLQPTAEEVIRDLIENVVLKLQ